MTTVSRTQIEEALTGRSDPYLGTDLVSAKAVKDIRVDGDRVEVDLELGFPAAGYKDELASQVKESLAAVPGIADVQVHVASRIIPHSVQKGIKPLPAIKNIIAVASGKGGVGKSTTTANLALALSAEGASVGVLDADIYGPNQPRMLGITGKPMSKDGKSMEPLENHGIQSMSVGYLVDDETPMIWRGPMVTKALEQLLQDTNWRDAGLPGRRSAAGHRRYSADPGPAYPGQRGGDRHHAPGHLPARRAQGPAHVPPGEGGGTGHHREHEHPYLQPVRP